MAEGYKDWSAGDILTAADLEDYTVKQSVMRFADASARTSALSGVLAEGMVSYLKDTDSVEVYDGSAWAAVGGGKILQVVRATDTTTRTTTSLTFVDANISVTITPTSATSNILLLWSVHYDSTPSTGYALGVLAISDSSNNLIDGTGDINHGVLITNRLLLRSNFIAWDSPATTSATTYKGRFHSAANNTVNLYNATSTGQLFALEISA